MIRARAVGSLRALGVVAWLAAGPAVAQDEPDTHVELADALRPCTPADLVGTWEVIRFGVVPAARVDRSDPYFYPYQRYVFAANATMRHLTSKARITRAAHRALLARATPATWAVDGQGRLRVHRDEEAHPETAACDVLTRVVVDPRSGMASPPGDVLLTHADRSDTPVMRRQLRRLDGLDE